jgi:hypothetical protein
MGSKWVGRFYLYLCQAGYATLDEAHRALEEVTRLISKATGWQVVEESPPDRTQSVVMIKKVLEDLPFFRISVERSNQVLVELFPDYVGHGRSAVTTDLTAAVLHRVLAASSEKVPFGSITGDRQGSDRWETTQALPGADQCSISTIGKVTYSCFWSGPQPAALYDLAMDVIRKTGDWVGGPATAVANNVRASEFRCDLRHALLVLALREDNEVVLTVFAPSG